MDWDKDFTWDKQKEEHIKLLDKFIEKEFRLIQKEFSKEGIDIKSKEDVSTFKGWNKQGRKIVKGKKSVPIEGNNLYPQILFRNGNPKIDENGNKMVRKYKKTYNLFAKEQTREKTKETKWEHDLQKYNQNQ